MLKILLQIILIINIDAFSFPQSGCNGVGEIKYTNATYTGECKNNKKEGRGRIVFNNGVKYEGEYKNDKKNGHGTQFYSNGMIYNGLWKNGKYNGNGSLKYNSKEKYDGSWKMGKKNGKGKYIYLNGSVYDGSWKNDAKHGYGVFKYANGIVYKGDFVNNIKSGKGSMTYKSGDKYKGEFKNDKQNGYGVYTLAKGGSYSGQFKNNKKNGEGKYIYKSGSVYDGSWVNNKKEGKGKFIHANGNVYDGSWVENKKEGRGKLIYANGNVYIGSFKVNKKTSYGVMRYKSGKIYAGSWLEDKQNGSGKETTQYGTCRGVWSKGELLSITDEYTQGEAYKHFNEIRISAGMSELKYNEILQKSAQSHSDYIGFHVNTLKGLGFHKEKEGLKGFSGVRAKDRAIKAGYFSTNVGEGISNYCSAQTSINSLMSAIYHRFGILNFTKDEVGIGFTQSDTLLKRNLVHNTGNSNLNTLCQGDSVWFGNYYEEVCADKEQKIKIDPYNEAKDKIKEKNPKYVIWPVDGSVDNLYYFSDEIPNPMPDFVKTGNPVSIQFNPFYFPKNIVVYSFRIFDDKEEITETRLLTKQTDPNKKFTKNQYALFPLKPLKRDTEYKVVIKYKYEGNSKQVSSSFRTMK